MTIASLARPEIRALLPYQAAVQVTDTIRLNANEAPWTSRFDDFRRPLNRYPEIRPVRLQRKLAQQPPKPRGSKTKGIDSRKLQQLLQGVLDDTPSASNTAGEGLPIGGSRGSSTGHIPLAELILWE